MTRLYRDRLLALAVDWGLAAIAHVEEAQHDHGEAHNETGAFVCARLAGRYADRYLDTQERATS